MAMCNETPFMIEKNSASSGVQSVDLKSLFQVGCFGWLFGV